MSNTLKKRKLGETVETSSASSSEQPECPSATLRELSSLSPHHTVIKLLEDKLYPILDALPKAQRVAICKALMVTRDQRESMESQRRRMEIAYHDHAKTLHVSLNYLNHAVAVDGRDGWETQGEMMENILEEVLDWLPLLWQVAVEAGHEIRLVRQCLVVCSDAIQELVTCGSSAEIEDMNSAVTITDSQDTTVYEENAAEIQHTLAWMWKELLVAASARGVETRDIEFDIHRLYFKDNVYSFIRRDGQDKQASGYGFWDAHWTPAMKDAASRILTSYSGRGGGVASR